jgi:hypothetical protein
MEYGVLRLDIALLTPYSIPEMISLRVSPPLVDAYLLYVFADHLHDSARDREIRSTGAQDVDVSSCSRGLPSRRVRLEGWLTLSAHRSR